MKHSALVMYSGSFEQVRKLRDDLVRAVSDTAVYNALFELGCLLSMASADSFDSGTRLESFAWPAMRAHFQDILSSQVHSHLT